MEDRCSGATSLVGLSSKNRFRSQDVTSAPDDCESFEQLGLPAWLVSGLNKAGFEKPSPIQAKAIPLARYGADLIVQAKAGTGKTCVFAVAALETVDITINSPQVIVLAPTREIAIQIQDVINSISEGCLVDLKCRSFIGGLSIKEDINQVKRCHVVVGTPGRIKQLIEERNLDMSALKVFVMDEADKLLDDKFDKIVNWICSVLPERKQMMALSATYPERLAQFLQNYMRDPLYVRLDSDSMALVSIKQVVHNLRIKDGLKGRDATLAVYHAKQQFIDEMLKVVNFNQCLVFCNMHASAEQLTQSLKNKGWSVAFIAGSQSQTERIENMRRMKNYEIRVFVCTDLISRGVDLEHVDLVVNMDVPQDWKTYIHRVGRAGRFGDKGAAFTLLSGKEDAQKIKIIAKRCNLDYLMLIDNVSTLSTNFITEDFSDIHTDMVQKFKQFSVWNSVEVVDDGNVASNGRKKISEVVFEDEEKLTGEEKLSMNSGSERSCDSYDREVSADDLTIPKDLYGEIDGLVQMYNSMFKGPVKKVKLNVDQFTYHSFKDHYAHFHKTGEFKEMSEWTTVEYEPIPKLTMKNFLKPMKALPKKNVANDASTQTDEYNCLENGILNSNSEEISNHSQNEPEATIVNTQEDQFQLNDSSPFTQSLDQMNDQARIVHSAYLNSAQHVYLSNMMTLYYGS